MAPFASIVIEVTEAELAQVMDGRLPLPHGWRLAEEIEEAGSGTD